MDFQNRACAGKQAKHFLGFRRMIWNSYVSTHFILGWIQLNSVKR